MPLYWVGYDLIKPDKDYTTLIHHLQTLRAHRIVFSDWLLPSKATAAQLRDDIFKYMDADDRLIVAEVKTYAAWINLKLPDAAVKQ
jgi:hypothetical protein